mmetsp:Transcript_91662/g.238913  ORF Transcript_91662/g.238913 Transcript_91662/m.238913 type:complete len:341 (-) Transcript_91662:114-1136(-)
MPYCLPMVAGLHLDVLGKVGNHEEQIVERHPVSGVFCVEAHAELVQLDAIDRRQERTTQHRRLSLREERPLANPGHVDAAVAAAGAVVEGLVGLDGDQVHAWNLHRQSPKGGDLGRQVARASWLGRLVLQVLPHQLGHPPGWDHVVDVLALGGLREIDTDHLLRGSVQERAATVARRDGGGGLDADIAVHLLVPRDVTLRDLEGVLAQREPEGHHIFPHGRDAVGEPQGLQADIAGLHGLVEFARGLQHEQCQVEMRTNGYHLGLPHLFAVEQELERHLFGVVNDVLVGDEQGVRVRLDGEAAAQAHLVLPWLEGRQPIESLGNRLDADNALAQVVKVGK